RVRASFVCLGPRHADCGTKKRPGVCPASLHYFGLYCLRAPRRRAAGVALEAGAVPNEREVAALAAGVALVALEAGGERALGLDDPGVRLGPVAARRLEAEAGVAAPRLGRGGLCDR